MNKMVEKMDPFLMWLYTVGRKESTIEKHGVRLGVLKRHIKNWTSEEIDAFIVMKRREGAANKTINAYLDTVRTYCRFKNYPIPKFSYLKDKTKKPKGILTNDEIEQLINMQCPERSEPDIWEKWSLFFKCCALTGARPGEIAKLTRAEIDLGRMSFYFHDTKTGNPRKCPIPKLVQKSIEGAYRASQGYIFTTRSGKIFNDDAWRHAFNKRLELLNIDRPNITLYSLRHSFITTLIEEDVSIFKIAETVGHDPSQTRAYTHLSSKHIEKTINRHPLVRAGNNSNDVLSYVEDVFNALALDDRFNRSVSRDGKSLTIKIEEI